LQEVYGHLMRHYQAAIAHFAGTAPFVTPGVEAASKNPERIIFFVLECLSNLITGRGSVLSMWALDPPVFVVLSRHSGLQTRNFAARYPWLHFTLLSSLRMLCTSNLHFLSSSTIMLTAVTSQSTVSPTSENFKNTIELITEIFNKVGSVDFV